MSQDSCPADILLLISNYLDVPSKKQLCLVSQYFHSIFALIVLQKVRILFCQERGSTSKSIDERLLSSQSNLSNVVTYARSLRVNTKGYYVTRHVTSSLLPALWETIARMTSLTSLELEWARYDSDQKMETVMEYQEHIVTSVLEATGDQLDQLILKPDSGTLSLPASLVRIRGLKSLRIVNDGRKCLSSYPDDIQEDQLCGCYRPWMKDVIRPLIAANPELESLEIKQACQNYGPDVDDILPESLTNLTSLTISGLKMPAIQTGDTSLICLSPLRNLRHLVVRVPSGTMNIDAFWEALTVAKPPLETLSSFQVSQSLLKYLASCSGLRSLEISRINWTEDCGTFEFYELAITFLRSVLPQHAEFLERLVINYGANIYSIPGWDFDPTTWAPALSQLSRLRYLALCPHLPLDGTNSWSTSAPDLTKAYQTILDNVADLTSLHTLKINFTEPKSGCGTGYMRWSSGVCKTLGKVVPVLRVVGGRPKVLVLYHATQYCSRLDGEHGDVWGYNRG